MSVMNIVTACIVILIMAVLSVVAIRFGYKALLIEWAIDAISKAEKEFVGTKLGEARLAVVVSWLREKVPAPIRFLVTDDLIRKAVQTSFNAAKSGLEVLKMLKRLVDWLLDRLPVTRWIELLTQPED